MQDVIDARDHGGAFQHTAPFNDRCRQHSLLQDHSECDIVASLNCSSAGTGSRLVTARLDHSTKVSIDSNWLSPRTSKLVYRHGLHRPEF